MAGTLSTIIGEIGYLFAHWNSDPVSLGILSVLVLMVSVVPGVRSLLIQFSIFPAIKRLIIDPYYAANPGADKKARRDLNLEVEEDEPAAEGDEPVAEPVFVDTLPQKEETEDKPARALPRQYNEKEMRHFNHQVNSRGADNDDDTI